MTTLEKYRKALQEVAARRGLMMNPDEATVRPLLEGLLTNGQRYGVRTCPCRPATGDLEKDRDIVCPCVYAEADVAEYGACYCWLFVSQDWVEGKIPRRRVPERRPPERTMGL